MDVLEFLSVVINRAEEKVKIGDNEEAIRLLNLGIKAIEDIKNSIEKKLGKEEDEG